MTALRFVLRGEPAQRLDLSPLTPDRLAGLETATIEAITLHTTRQAVTVGDVFRVHPGDAGTIVIEGGSARFDRIGAAMSQGSLLVEGDAGQQAGRLMTGGRLTIRGHAGDRAASGLQGGVLEINGDAGDFLAGPLAGERTGMRGGVLLVRGRAGTRAGDRLRRGLVIVEGDAGEYAGSAMVAGTLVVCGAAGALPGILMRRGTIVLGQTSVLAPSFIAAARADLVFTALLARAVAPFSARAAACVLAAGGRYLGDMATLGKGEIFVST